MSSLFKKYDTPGPRYTSYPTVPCWTDSPSESTWMDTLCQTLTQNQARKIGAAIYVHIPFCESLCTYCGCNTRISRNHKVANPYIDTVLMEWQLYKDKIARESSAPILLSELHFGGGTPTFLEPSELKRLMEGLLEGAVLSPDFEFSVEADPRVTNEAHLEVLATLPGRRRLSLGIQDFDPAVQQIVHRVQSEQEVAELTVQARAMGFESINYDLIYGLPLQTSKSVQKTIEIVSRLRPDRIAFYGYAHVPWIKPGQRRFTEQDLPSGDEKRGLYELGREILEQVGYREVGMDHFALTSDSLWQANVSGELHRNFMGYTCRQVAPLLGLGVSAIGDAWGAFAQNEKLLETYEKRVRAGEFPIFRGHVLTSEDLILRRHILNLMTRFVTHWDDASMRTPFLDSIKDRLESFKQDGLVEVGEKNCKITPQGRPFIRNICMAFDARLASSQASVKGGAPIFSRTI